jgi:Outer membrane lipoprotein-sorting protein
MFWMIRFLDIRWLGPFKPYQSWRGATNLLLSMVCCLLVSGVKPHGHHEAVVDPLIANIRESREGFFRSNEHLEGRIRKGGFSISFRVSLKSPYVEIWLEVSGDRFRVPVNEAMAVQELREGRWIPSQSTLTTLIAGTPVSFEDIAFRFLFWPHPENVGTGTVRTKSCSIVRFTAPASQSAYNYVDVWFDQNSNAPLLAVCYGTDGAEVKRFDPVKFHRVEDAWVVQSVRVTDLKQMPGSLEDPTYIEFASSSPAK